MASALMASVGKSSEDIIIVSVKQTSQYSNAVAHKKLYKQCMQLLSLSVKEKENSFWDADIQITPFGIKIYLLYFSLRIFLLESYYVAQAGLEFTEMLLSTLPPTQVFLF